MPFGSDRPVIRRRLSRRFEVGKVLEGALVGLFAGIVVTTYRLVLSRAEGLLRAITQLSDSSPLGLLYHVLAAAALFAVVVLLVRWEPDASGSGIPQTEGEVAGFVSMSWWRVLVAKFLGGAAVTAAGLSLGREGPSVQLGGVCGKAVARLLGKERGEERLLVTCGAASGMSAAFSAPLTGVMFAFEEIHHVMSGPLVVSVMFSSVIADFVASRVLGMRPVLSFPIVAEMPLGWHYLLVLAIGVVAGLLGALHNAGMFASQEISARIEGRAPLLVLALSFLLAGVFAHVFPEVTCGGDEMIGLLEIGRTPVGLLMVLLVGKYLFTCLCFGSKAPGGTLFPMVAMGAVIGLVFGELASTYLGVDPSYLNYFVVLGIVGLFSGAVRAPVTSVVMAFELTGSLNTLLAAVLVSVTAFVTSEVMGVEPFYEKLYADLAIARAGIEDDSLPTSRRNVRTHVVEPGSDVEGKTLAEIGWPEEAHVINIARGGVDIVPRGSTRLMALDEILVSMGVSNEHQTEERIKELVRSNIGVKR